MNAVKKNMTMNMFMSSFDVSKKVAIYFIEQNVGVTMRISIY